MLHALDFDGTSEVCPRFDNGSALWQTVVEYQRKAAIGFGVDLGAEEEGEGAEPEPEQHHDHG
jgi:hypothetical protein